MNVHSPACGIGWPDPANGLDQSSLPELGTQSVISEILNGKRRLNVRQIKALTKRFELPADLFLD